MSLKRILFVDDEVNILDGLRNVLRKQRKQWDMVFAVGGAAALEELAKGPFDVIVSDMRMPGMDGATLLTKVKEQYPSTARIVLSGHAEQEAVMRVLPVAHQFLSKPCDEEQLRSVVERTCALQSLLHDGATRDVISAIDRLPAVPQVYWQIEQAVAQANISLEQVAEIVAQDASLVAKILQIVNSAFFGLRHRVTSIPQAIQYLGLDLIKGLTLTGVFNTYRIAPVNDFSVEELQHHSLVTARLARKLAPEGTPADDVFSAAIVHDVGQLILAHGFREQFGQTRTIGRDSGRPFHEAEMEVFGTTHAEIGAYLLGIWGLPMPIVEAVAYHHRPGMVGGSERGVLAAVHLADVLVGTAHPDRSDQVTEQRLDIGFLESCGVQPDLTRWGELTRQELQGAAVAG
jgi:putative nucleotidyltransferase with HDIG domain